MTSNSPRRPRQPQPTHSLVAVLRALVAASDPLSARDLAEASGVTQARVAPTVGQLVRLGWLTGEWEHAEEVGPRQVYLLSIRGRAEAAALLATDKAQQAARPPHRVQPSFTKFEAITLREALDAVDATDWPKRCTALQQHAFRRAYNRLVAAILEMGARP